MSSLYGFDIPHDKGEPCRDLIAIQIPYPPSRVRSIWIPDISREFGSHGVQAGIIRQMGPLAFSQKVNGEYTKQRAEIGDWVLIRWGAGTIFQAGRGILNAVGGWRYLSTFSDVIKIIPAQYMPDPTTLEWTDEGVTDGPLPGAREPELPFEAPVRERHVYRPKPEYKPDARDVQSFEEGFDEREVEELREELEKIGDHDG